MTATPRPAFGDTCEAGAMIKRSAAIAGKGWFAGPWDTNLPVAVGYTDRVVHDPHVHASMYEVYLVARGTSTALVSDQRVELQAGDMLVAEPGESHTFAASSDDYLHFVVQAPFVDGDRRVT